MRLICLALLLALGLGVGPAWAEGLRVTLILNNGMEPVRYTLSDAQTRTFWEKWRQLPPGEKMPPLAPNDSYAGLSLYDDARGNEIRLFKGAGRSDDSNRSDDYRQLERWVLTLAPPPLGPALVAALDEQVSDTPQGRIVTQSTTKTQDGGRMIEACRKRAPRNLHQRALCLQEALNDQLDPAAYARGLEELALRLLPPQERAVPESKNTPDTK